MIYIAVEHPFDALIGPFNDEAEAGAYAQQHVGDDFYIVDTDNSMTPDEFKASSIPPGDDDADLATPPVDSHSA